MTWNENTGLSNQHFKDKNKFFWQGTNSLTFALGICLAIKPNMRTPSAYCIGKDKINAQNASANVKSK